MVGADATAGRITTTPAETNAFVIPNAEYLIDLRRVVVNDPTGGLVVGDLPTAAGIYHVYADADDEIDELFIPDDGFRLARADELGLAYLGTVTTTGAVVTAVDGSASNYIQPLRFLQSRGGDDGTGGDVDLSAIFAQLTDLNNRVAELESNTGGGLVAVPTRSEAQQAEFQLVLTFLVEVFPGLGRLIQTAVDVPGSTGNREPLPDGPARRVYAGGNAQRSGRSKSIR